MNNDCIIPFDPMSLPEGNRFHAHRSGHETYQYCPRKHYLAYKHLGTGVNQFPPLYFDVGSAVHAGLAILMEYGMKLVPGDEVGIEEARYAAEVAVQYLRDSPVYQVRLKPEERLEQETLIAGLFFAFYYSTWPQFIAKFEILAVEKPYQEQIPFYLRGVEETLNVHSRPDVIVRDRLTHEIVNINWKTINDPSDERRANITETLQVLLEHYYGERIYSQWVDDDYYPLIPEGLRGRALMKFIEDATAYYKTLPREIAYTQIIYLVKGNRSPVTPDGQEIDQDTAFGEYTEQEITWKQQSMLCYRYLNLDTGEASWSYRHYKANNKSYSNLTPKADWIRQPVWEAFINVSDDKGTDTINAARLWAEQLNGGQVFPSCNHKVDERNEVQPLNRVVIFENPIYRDIDRMTRQREQYITEQIRIAHRWTETMQRVAAGESYDDVLDQTFPQNLLSCRKPVVCEFSKTICNAPAEVRQPLFVQIEPESGWQRRMPHHEGERMALDQLGEG